MHVVLRNLSVAVNDVAVLTLSRPVKFSSCKRPIRLVKPKERISSKCVVAGWGKTDCKSVFL